MSPLTPVSSSLSTPPDAALATVLTLLHCYALRDNPDSQNPRLAQAILCQLEHLSEHPAVAAPLRRTCEQLYDAWLPLSRKSCRSREI
ncbi:hypothetical protein [Azovibrio restrictus]|uniref:hypothetical protein n=1 Tax=Azovibrio restrictus TaxID=146938 RepID=UPI0003F6A0BC|nr:hypothetical protein [Azovibrio restrictus]